MTSLTLRINTYFAMLTITVIGAGASLIIMHIANTALAAPPSAFVSHDLTKALHDSP